MQIKQISGIGLKTTDFSHRLQPVNIIVGRNFSGKTAILEAVRLALGGYIPELGKQNVATGGLCRNGSMEVQVDFDGGAFVKRNWDLRGSTWKSSFEEFKVKPIPAVMLDPNEYFHLGDKDRVRYVFGKTRMAEMSGEAVVAAVRGLRIEDSTEETEVILSGLVAEIDASDSTRHQNDVAVQAWLECLIADIATRTKEAKQNADRMRKTVEGLAVLPSDLDAVDLAPKIKAATKLKDDATTLAAEALAKYEMLLGQSAAYWKAKDRLATLPALDVTALEAKRDALWQSTSTFKDASHEAGVIVNQLTQSLAKLDDKKHRLEISVATAKEKLAAMLSHDCCPTCKAAGTGWADAVKAEFTKVIEDAEAEINAMTLAIEERQELLGDAQEDHKAARQDNSTNALNVAEWKHTVEEIKRRTEAAKAHTDLSARLSAMPNPTPAEVAAAQDAAQVAKALRDIRSNELDALVVQQRSFDRIKLERSIQAKARLELVKAKADLTVKAAVLKRLEQIQTEMVEAAFGSILATANRLCAPMLNSPLEYRDGEIGRQEGSAWVRHKTFSGTEKAIAYAAISIALASDSECRLVMVDEMGRLDPENKTKLVELADSLIAEGLIDQFIGVDATNGLDKWPEFVNVVRVA